MKKIILVVATFITVARIAFAASCYKYHYEIRVKCRACNQSETLEVDRNDNHNALLYANDCFSNHAEDCTNKYNDHSRMEARIKSKKPNDYEKCN